jgi:hypothetical protein
MIPMDGKEDISCLQHALAIYKGGADGEADGLFATHFCTRWILMVGTYLATLRISESEY